MHAATLEAALRAAMPGDVDVLLGVLDAHARGLDPRDPDQADQARRCIEAMGYVEANRRGTANYRVIPLASSGPMEKAVDITICCRFKSRGMSWFRQGVGHLLHLRLLRPNGSWARHWADRRAASSRPWPAAA